MWIVPERPTAAAPVSTPSLRNQLRLRTGVTERSSRLSDHVMRGHADSSSDALEPGLGEVGLKVRRVLVQPTHNVMQVQLQRANWLLRLLCVLCCCPLSNAGLSRPVIFFQAPSPRSSIPITWSSVAEMSARG